MMKAFVTGGSGFIGTNLIHLLLDQGFEVRTMVRPGRCISHLKSLPVELAYTDLNSSHLAFHLEGCEVLFHVAAQYSLWQSDRDLLYQSNVLGTKNLLAAAKAAGIQRTVYTSSVAAIGLDPAAHLTSHLTDETYQSPPEALIGAYKQSKYWAEQEALMAARSGQEVVIVNPTSPIGAWDGKPTPTDDIIAAWIDEMILTQFGKTPSLAIDSVRMSQQKMYYSSQKAIAAFGLPQTDLKIAIEAAVKWYRDRHYCS